MTAQKFPFRLTHAFFKTVEFDRAPSLPDPLQVDFSTQIRVHEDRLPDVLQIDLKIETESDQLLTFNIEMIGVFNLLEGQPRPDRPMVNQFVNERALYMLWPYSEQLVRVITSQMGMNPLNLRTPYEYSFELPGEPAVAPTGPGAE